MLECATIGAVKINDSKKITKYIVYKKYLITHKGDEKFGGGQWVQASPPLMERTAKDLIAVISKKRFWSAKMEPVDAS